MHMNEPYIGTIDDYIEDVYTRDLLDQAQADLPDDLKPVLAAALEEPDRLFMASSTDEGANSLSRYANVSNGWWWRLPKELGDLKPYIQQ